MSDSWLQIAALIVPLVIAIVFHEIAHGWVALALGDPTAKERRRLSPNPLRHVDPVGTVILPGMLALAHLPVFGWAKPVPVIKERLRHPRSGMMLVAAAGPASNLIQALVGAGALGLMLRAGGGLEPTGVAGFVALNLVNYVMINVFLALFNLLPVPPFDGGHIVEGLLPRPLATQYARMHRFAVLIMLGLLVVLPLVLPQYNLMQRFVLPPAQWLIERYVALAGAIGGG